MEAAMKTIPFPAKKQKPHARWLIYVSGSGPSEIDCYYSGPEDGWAVKVYAETLEELLPLMMQAQVILATRMERGGWV